jgi:phosphoglucosamine mutase
VANRELSPELAMRLGRAGAYILTRESNNAKPKVLIGKDTRRSGDMLEAALTAGLCSIGAEVHQAGDIPSPAVAYLVRHYGFDAGVMISASHNPMADNGIKFFNRKGQKLSDAMEDEIETIEAELKKNDALPKPIGEAVGRLFPCPQAVTDYTSFLLSTVPDLKVNNTFTVALDCANGATSRIAPQIFAALGAKVETLHNQPDGTNINKNCGSTHMGSLCAHMTECGADIGLAFDGDGDRMLAVDEKGKPLDGDAIMAICGLDLHRRGALNGSTLVGTVMSNQGLDVFCKQHGITLHRTDVGDRYVLEKMLADDLSLGGEQSGHVIFRQYNDTGDGILTGLQLIAAMARAGKPLSQLRGIIEVFPQVLVNARLSGERKHEYATHEAISSALTAIEAKLAEQEGRILVRPSGTEPLVRVMIEGRDQETITKWANGLAQLIEETLK